MDSNPLNSASGQEQDRFLRHLERATATVRSWPFWKQTLLGGVQGDMAGPAERKAIDEKGTEDNR